MAVVNLRGEPSYSPGEPVKEIVDMLEKALAEAKSGNLRAAAIATVLCPDTSYPLIDGGFWAAPEKGRDLYTSFGRIGRRIERWLDE